MIDLKSECEKLHIDINYLIEHTGTPRQTLKDWCIKHPKRINAFLDSIRYQQFIEFGDGHLQEALL